MTSALFSLIIASLGFLPSKTLRFLVFKCLGGSWSDAAVEAACTHLTQVKYIHDDFVEASPCSSYTFYFIIVSLSS